MDLEALLRALIVFAGRLAQPPLQRFASGLQQWWNYSNVQSRRMSIMLFRLTVHSLQKAGDKVIVVGDQFWHGGQIGPEEIKRVKQVSLLIVFPMRPGFRRFAEAGKVMEPSVLEFLRPAVAHVPGVLAEESDHLDSGQAGFFDGFTQGGSGGILPLFDGAGRDLDAGFRSKGLSKKEDSPAMGHVGVCAMACFHGEKGLSMGYLIHPSNNAPDKLSG